MPQNNPLAHTAPTNQPNTRTMITTSTHPLFSAALKADEQYERTITTQFPGQTRWTITKAQEAMQAIRDAYDAKVSADAAWTAWMQAKR